MEPTATITFVPVSGTAQDFGILTVGEISILVFVTEDRQFMVIPTLDNVQLQLAYTSPELAVQAARIIDQLLAVKGQQVVFNVFATGIVAKQMEKEPNHEENN